MTAIHINLLPKKSLQKRLLRGANIAMTVGLVIQSTFGFSPAVVQALSPARLKTAATTSASSVETGAVCPAGDVKYEIPGGYEYTDGSATISGDGEQISWSAAPGFTIVSICVKIGGPGGGTLQYPPVSQEGTAGPYDYGISHVVITARPTPPSLTACTLYGYNDQGVKDSQFFKMNLQTGTVTDIGAVATDEDIEAIDARPSTGTIYGFPDNGSDDTSAVLVTINRDTGARSFVANVSSDFELPGASFNPATDELWVGADTNDNLYTVNLTTGVLTLKLDASKSGEPQALAWNNAGTLLYVAYGGASGTKVYTTDGASALAEVADLNGEIEAMEFDENGNLLVGQHGDQNLYVLVGGALVDTGKNFNGNDVETLTTVCPEEPTTGSVKVDKKVDADGDGEFEGGNPEANQLGFDWGLDQGTVNRNMGTTAADVQVGGHTVTENAVSNYHFVGWYPSGSTQYSCANPQGTDLPAPVTVNANETAQTTFCNARNTGTLTVVKHVVGDGAQADDWTMHIGGLFSFAGSESGTSRVVPTGEYTVTESDGPQNFALSYSGDCDSSGQVSVGAGEHKTCTLTNTENPPAEASLTVIKHVVGGSAQADDWTMHIKQGDADVFTFAGAEDPGTTKTVSTGSFRVTESDGPSGYTLAYSGDCDRIGNVTLSVGQHKTCTLTNTRDTAFIVVNKYFDDDGDGDPDRFNPPGWTWGIEGGSQDNPGGATRVVPTGSVTVSEDAIPGYSSEWSCSNDDPGDGTSFTVPITKNEELICEFTNTKNPEPPQLTVFKHVGGGSANADDFTMHVGGLSFEGNEAGTTKTLNPGAYTVAESGPAGYTLAYSGDCDASGNVSLSNDQHKTCTLTNTRQQGRIKIVKVLSDQSDPYAWTFTVSGHPGDLNHNEYATLDTGNYAVAEHGPEGYTLTDATGICSLDDNQVTMHVTLDGGTCTLFNTKNPEKPTLTVIKQVVGGTAGAADWQLHVKHGNADVDGSPQNGDEQGTHYTLYAGTFTVSETGGPLNYTPSFSGDCTQDGTVNLEDGQHKTCTLTNTRDTGSVTVNKLLDADGNGTFESGNSQANAAGFRWNLDNVLLSNAMGAAVSPVVTGSHSVDEPAVNGYHFVGWYPTGDERFSCNHPQSTTLPATINVAKAATADITLCNAKNATTIGLTKIGPATVVPGDVIAYTLSWSVSGNAAGTNAVVTDPLPANTTFVSAGCGTTVGACTINSATSAITWSLGTRNPGETGTLTLNVRAITPLANGTVITNTGTFKVDQTDPVSASALTTVQSSPTIGIAKTDSPDPVPAGQNLTYTITWTIGGNAPATNVIVTDPIPANTAFVSADNGGMVSAGVVTWTLGTKNPGDTGTLKLVVKVASPIANGTLLTNTATVDSSENAPLSATATTTVTSAPILALTKVSNVTGFANPTQTVVYTLVVGNAATATDTAKNVSVTDTLPAGFAFEDGTTTKTFSVGDLAPGASKTISVNAVIKAEATAGSYTNTAKAKGDNTPEVTATAPVEVRVPQVLTEETHPVLTIHKSVSPSAVNPGSTVHYKLLVKNVGDGTAFSVVITDTLPKGLSFVDKHGQLATFPIGDLTPGQSFLLTYDVKVNNDTKAGTYKNVAVARADNAPAVTDHANVKVRTVKVLAATGPSAIDGLIIGLGLILTGLGLTLFLRRPKAEIPD